MALCAGCCGLGFLIDPSHDTDSAAAITTGASAVMEASGATVPDTAETTAATAEIAVTPSTSTFQGIPPKPDTTTQTAYIEDLNAINPEIVGDHEDGFMVNWGRNICGEFAKFPNDHAGLVERTNTTFIAPDYSEGFGTATAERILAVVHSRICPTYTMP